MISVRSLCIALACVAVFACRTPTSALSPEEAAWIAFCNEVERAGLETLRDAGLEHEIDRAEGLRYLAQQLASSAQQVVREREQGFPLLRIGATNVDKWGLDGADVRYTGTELDSSGVYRLRGRSGNARIFAIQLARLDDEYEAFDALSNEQIGTAASGAFEVVIAAERPDGYDGVFLPLDLRANMLLVREYFGSWDDARVAELRIERLDSAQPALALDLIAATALLDDIATRFERRAPQWLGRTKQLRRFGVNRFFAQDASGQGLADNVYGMGWYRVATDEALVIELEAPDALLWSFQLGNLWWESHDYVTRIGSLNGDQLVASSDGRYRLVVAHDDPGVPNWLDAAQRPEGLVLYRFQRTRTRPEPTARLVDLSELRSLLPADTPSLSREERAAEIEARRAHAVLRWSP